MESVLVMGINGTFASHVAEALLNSGYKVSAFMRNPDKLPAKFKGMSVIQGDMQDQENIRRACENIDIVVYGISPSNYDWEGKALPYLENLASVAEEKGLCIVFPGNVYVFNPKEGPEFDESAHLNPITRKGEIRKAMELRLQRASSNGAKIIILRMGDFIAPESASSWLPRLIKNSRHGYKLTATGPASLPHTWAYVPDAAKVVVSLLQRRATIPTFAVFHFKGFRVSFSEIAQTITQVSGKSVKISAFPWWALKLISPFSILIRGLLEMRYLWNSELNLSDHKLRSLIGDSLQMTSLVDALLESKLVEKQELSTSENIHQY